MRRAKRIDICIRQVFSSLKSHLPYTYKKSKEGTKFHKKCVREYASIMKHLSKLY